MPVIEFEQETMPETREEFSLLLEEARRNANPLDDLWALGRPLLSFEQRYDLGDDTAIGALTIWYLPQDEAKQAFGWDRPA